MTRTRESDGGTGGEHRDDKSSPVRGDGKHKKDRKSKRSGKPKKGKREGERAASGAAPAAPTEGAAEESGASRKLSKSAYEKQLERLQLELVKLQYWVKQQGLRMVCLFEGRDAAGKGGVIKRIAEPLNPRGCRVVALGTPSDRERTQWYFQRYVEHLPAAGEIVLFDRSWYNRSGVERVMGFCTKEEYREFLRSCPEFERMIVRSGIVLLKYWFSVSDEEQERRFRSRAAEPHKRWKLSPMDLESRTRWVDYSKAKDVMFDHCDIVQAPWFVVPSDDKRRAHLNCIAHLLSSVHYEDVIPPVAIEFPPRQQSDYERPPMAEQKIVPELF